MKKIADIKKQANPIIAHLLQNLAGRAMMRFPDKTGFGNVIIRNLAAPEKGMRTAGGNLLYGGAGALIPEVGIMGEKASSAGHAFYKYLKQNNIDIDDLTPRDLVVLRRAMRGDFNKAYQSNSPLAKKLTSSFLRSAFPGAGKQTMGASRLSPQDMSTIANVLQETPRLTDAQRKILFGELGKTYRNNRLTGNLAAMAETHGNRPLYPRLLAFRNRNKDNILGKLVEPFAKKRTENIFKRFNDARVEGNQRLNSIARNSADAAANAALFAVDPLTGGFNAVKRIADAKWLPKERIMNGRLYNPAHRVGATTQRELGDMFVGDPLETSFRSGFQGNRVQPLRVEHSLGDLRRAGSPQERRSLLRNWAKETADSQIVNPFTAAAKDLANGAGYAMRRAGVTEKNLSGMARAARAGNILPEPSAPTMYRRVKSTLLDKLRALRG